MADKPSILVCNDDGITAPGLHALVDVAREFGTVTVVAPDSPQSGMGHAITIGKPLRLHEEKWEHPDVQAWACSGTPVDCVKLATGEIMDKKPDLLVSGINHGSNFSISVVYSGTISAAMEGAIEGIPSIGFSLCDFRYDADFGPSQVYARKMIAKALENQMPDATLLSVNIPKMSLEEIKGMKVVRQAIGRFDEKFDKRIDPNGRPYYWLTGAYVDQDGGEDSDTWALRNGYVSVCPVQFDLTAHHTMNLINQWDIHASATEPSTS